MLDFPRWKLIMIGLATFFGLLLASPNFFDEDTQAVMEQQAFLPHKTVSLGLDLQGGVFLLINVEVDEIEKGKLENLSASVRDELRKLRSEYNVIFQRIRIDAPSKSVLFDVRDDTNIDRVERAMDGLTELTSAGGSGLATYREQEWSRDDLAFRLTLTETGLNLAKRQAVVQTMEVIRRRIDPEGTREITVQGRGDDQIMLEVPGADDPTALRSLVETTARLTFHDVDTSVTNEDFQQGRPRAGFEYLPLQDGGMISIQKRIIVSGEYLTSAKAGFSQENGQPIVNFRFNGTGAKRFGEHTAKNVNRPFAIRLDDIVISAPNIQSPILGGAGYITAGSPEEANELGTLLSAGSLPVSLNVEMQGTVDPSLGAASVQAGTMAAAIGMMAVIAYMVISYGWFGVAANVALIVNLFLILGLLSVFNATLTLPGIAGIVLTIGMAVDANVLVFERIKEEHRAGRGAIQSVDTGYSQAFSTIMDANITTFIAAAILYMLGSGPVQGFAVTLAVGILTSLFSAVMLTRLILAAWLKRSRPAKLPI